jgi:hypothetical protein
MLMAHGGRLHFTTRQRRGSIHTSSTVWLPFPRRYRNRPVERGAIAMKVIENSIM